MTRIEHLQSKHLSRYRYRCSLCYEDQFTSYFMLGKVILPTVNDSEKCHKLLFNGGSSTTRQYRALILSVTGKLQRTDEVLV